MLNYWDYLLMYAATVQCVIFSGSVLSLKLLDSNNFEKGCYKSAVLAETRQNIRSRIVCAGICARMNSCAGLKFETTKTCYLYRNGDICLTSDVQLDICFHLKLEFDSYHEECNKTTLTESSPSTTVNSSFQISASITSTDPDITTEEDHVIGATQLSAAITTIQQTNTPCKIDAAAELSNSLMLISGNVVYFYDDAASLFTGPTSFTLATSIFPQVTGQIDAAYTSLVFDFIYIIKGQNVYTYSLPNYTFISQQTGAVHFGLSDNLSFLDNVIKYSTEVHVFSTAADLVEIKNGAMTHISFTDSGNRNPYRTNNLALQPSTITAICHASNTVVLFFESNMVKQLQFGAGINGKGLWTDLGSVSC